MKRLIAGLSAISSIMLFGGTTSSQLVFAAKGPSHSVVPAAVQAHVPQTFGQLPMSFEPNSGQADHRARFLSHVKGSTVFLTSTGVVLTLTTPGPAPMGGGVDGAPLRDATARSEAIQMTFLGASPGASIVGTERLSGVSNYLIGNDPARWRTGVPHYAQVTYRNLYPGVDARFYGNQTGRLEYDLSLAPGTDPSIVRLAIRGSDATNIDQQGDLVMHLGGREIVQPRPRIYQKVGGSRRAIAGGYVIEGNHAGFSLGSFDRSLPLIIDPEVVYSTYLGGGGDDLGEIHPDVDGSGHAFICGITDSVDFPVTLGVVQPAPSGSFDGFITEMNLDGSGLVYSTFLGGAGLDDAQACKVDTHGNVYVGGFTASADFPVTSGAFQSVFKGGNGEFGLFSDGYVAKLSPNGSNLIYSTFLGGSGDENLNNIRLDAVGDAFVAGDTWSTDFPTTPGAYQASNAGGHGDQCPNSHRLSCNDEFVTKLNPTGSGLLYSTYLGGRGGDCCQPGLAVDSQGNAYIEGTTSSHSFPTTSEALQQRFAGGRVDLFVTKLNATASALVYSTYLGGSWLDIGSLGIAIDGSGNAYVDGVTCSEDFPVTPGAFQTKNAGPHSFLLCGDDFVSKINPQGSALVYSTYLGGSGWDQPGTGPLVDSAGRVYIAAGSTSTDFPITADAFQSTNHGGTAGWDGTVTELSANGSAMVFSSYLGGSGNDGINGAALDPSGNLYVTGCTESTDFPTTPGSLQRTFQGGDGLLGFSICSGPTDAFVTKLAFGN